MSANVRNMKEAGKLRIGARRKLLIFDSKGVMKGVHKKGIKCLKVAELQLYKCEVCREGILHIRMCDQTRKDREENNRQLGTLQERYGA